MPACAEPMMPILRTRVRIFILWVWGLASGDELGLRGRKFNVQDIVAEKIIESVFDAGFCIGQKTKVVRLALRLFEVLGKNGLHLLWRDFFDDAFGSEKDFLALGCDGENLGFGKLHRNGFAVLVVRKMAALLEVVSSFHGVGALNNDGGTTEKPARVVFRCADDSPLNDGQLRDVFLSEGERRVAD